MHDVFRDKGHPRWPVEEDVTPHRAGDLGPGNRSAQLRAADYVRPATRRGRMAPTTLWALFGVSDLLCVEKVARCCELGEELLFQFEGVGERQPRAEHGRFLGCVQCRAGVLG